MTVVDSRRKITAVRSDKYLHMFHWNMEMIFTLGFSTADN